jgi:hypothetical protein
MWLILVLSTVLILVAIWTPRVGLAAGWRNAREATQAAAC